jgi:hypothetical protein
MGRNLLGVMWGEQIHKGYSASSSKSNPSSTLRLNDEFSDILPVCKFGTMTYREKNEGQLSIFHFLNH